MIKSRLKEIADSRGLSIRQIASGSGYHFETVRRMYNDDMQHYPKGLLDSLCTYLGVGVGELLEHKKDTED